MTNNMLGSKYVLHIYKARRGPNFSIFYCISIAYIAKFVAIIRSFKPLCTMTPFIIMKYMPKY